MRRCRAPHDDRVVPRAVVVLPLARPRRQLRVERPHARLERGPQAAVLDLGQAVAREAQLPLQRARREAHRELLRGRHAKVRGPRDPRRDPVLGQLAVVGLEGGGRRGVADGLDLQDQLVVLVRAVQQQLVGLEAHDQELAAQPHAVQEPPEQLVRAVGPVPLRGPEEVVCHDDVVRFSLQEIPIPPVPDLHGHVMTTRHAPQGLGAVHALVRGRDGRQAGPLPP